MTLIVSWIHRNVAHQCCDSRMITGGQSYDNNNKLISLFEGRILIGVAGSWGVNGKSMPEYVEELFPKSSEMDKNAAEDFIQKFPNIFAAHIAADISKIEVDGAGVRITIIIETKTEFAIYGVDVKRTQPDGFNFQNLDYKIKAEKLYVGTGPMVIPRGHSEVEDAFNQAIGALSNTAYHDVLRQMINQNRYGSIIGGRVFCHHKIHDNKIEKIVDELCDKGELQSQRPSMLYGVKEIIKRAVDIHITCIAPGKDESQTSMNWDNRKVKININNESKGLNLLWDILHELGHIIDGMPGEGEDLSLERELSAWLNAYERYKELGLMMHRKSFIDRWNHCMGSYYRRNGMVPK